MTEVYFEAMEFHELERREKMEKYRDGYDKWVEENTDTYEYIQGLVKQGLPLGQEELEFLMRHAAENMYNKAITAEEEFFSHHFSRVERQRKADQESARKNRLIDDYSRTLKDIAQAHVPLFGAKQQLLAVKKDATDSIHRGQMYV